MSIRIAVAGILLASSSFAHAAPTGHITGIQNGSAVIAHTGNWRFKPLPGSKRPWKVSLGPDGKVIYFVTPAGQKEMNPSGDKTPTNGLISAPPYTAVRPLPGALQKQAPYSLGWLPNGPTFWFVNNASRTVTYNPRTNRSGTLAQRIESSSRDGQVIAYSDENNIYIRVGAARPRVVVSRLKPQPLFDALKRGRNQAKLKDLTGALDPSLWKEGRNWSFGLSALSPDGARMYFASNLGTGMGASGNTSFALFSYDIQRNRLDVMSNAGTFFGRTPWTFEVSPDGKRLLLTVSAHSSAADNSYYVTVVDLLTQRTREILARLPEAKDNANMLDSIAWSPDSRYIAMSAYFYNVPEIIHSEKDWQEPKDSQWTTYIVDAVTGKVVRRVKGLRELSWRN